MMLAVDTGEIGGRKGGCSQGNGVAVTVAEVVCRRAKNGLG